jgi:hypothetical protein
VTYGISRIYLSHSVTSLMKGKCDRPDVTIKQSSPGASFEKVCDVRVCHSGNG